MAKQQRLQVPGIESGASFGRTTLTPAAKQVGDFFIPQAARPRRPQLTDFRALSGEIADALMRFESKAQDEAEDKFQSEEELRLEAFNKQKGVQKTLSEFTKFRRKGLITQEMHPGTWKRANTVYIDTGMQMFMRESLMQIDAAARSGGVSATGKPEPVPALEEILQPNIDVLREEIGNSGESVLGNLYLSEGMSKALPMLQKAYDGAMIERELNATKNANTEADAYFLDDISVGAIEVTGATGSPTSGDTELFRTKFRDNWVNAGYKDPHDAFMNGPATLSVLRHAAEDTDRAEEVLDMILDLPDDRGLRLGDSKAGTLVGAQLRTKIQQIADRNTRQKNTDRTERMHQARDEVEDDIEAQILPVLLDKNLSHQDRADQAQGLLTTLFNSYAGKDEAVEKVRYAREKVTELIGATQSPPSEKERSDMLDLVIEENLDGLRKMRAGSTNIELKASIAKHIKELEGSLANSDAGDLSRRRFVNENEKALSALETDKQREKLDDALEGIRSTYLTRRREARETSETPADYEKRMGELDREMNKARREALHALTGPRDEYLKKLEESVIRFDGAFASQIDKALDDGLITKTEWRKHRGRIQDEVDPVNNALRKSERFNGVVNQLTAMAKNIATQAALDAEKDLDPGEIEKRRMAGRTPSPQTSDAFRQRYNEILRKSMDSLGQLVQSEEFRTQPFRRESMLIERVQTMLNNLASNRVIDPGEEESLLKDSNIPETRKATIRRVNGLDRLMKVQFTGTDVRSGPPNLDGATIYTYPEGPRPDALRAAGLRDSRAMAWDVLKQNSRNEGGDEAAAGRLKELLDLGQQNSQVVLRQMTFEGASEEEKAKALQDVVLFGRDIGAEEIVSNSVDPADDRRGNPATAPIPQRESNLMLSAAKKELKAIRGRILDKAGFFDLKHSRIAGNLAIKETRSGKLWLAGIPTGEDAAPLSEQDQAELERMRVLMHTLNARTSRPIKHTGKWPNMIGLNRYFESAEDAERMMFDGEGPSKFALKFLGRLEGFDVQKMLDTPGEFRRVVDQLARPHAWTGDLVTLTTPETPEKD